LTAAVATRARAENALEQYKKRAGKRTLAFCVSQRHADFMAEHFRNAGLRTAAVHSGETSGPRAASLELLRGGDLDVIFAVDMFNEGVDLPALDTVMMLRPTESKIMWMQQFGRGLRTSADKPNLTVIDYIGNHRTFLLKPLTLLGSLTPFKATDRDIWNALEKVRTGTAELPPGCEVTYELEAIGILESLLKLTSKPEQAVKEYYVDFKERNGQRPTALEAFHDGFSPRYVRKLHGSWFRFVERMGDLTPGQQSVLLSLEDFLESIETTPMTRSYKMLVLKALLKMDRLPGSIDIDQLAGEFGKLAATSARFRSDISVHVNDLKQLRILLRKDPIAAWIGAKGTQGKAYFELSSEETFRTTFSVAAAERESFRELAQELVEWRLAEYLGPESESKDESEEENSAESSPSLPGAPELWQPYQRRQVPPLFGLRFSTGSWNAGVVRADNHIFLLVTLAKETMGINPEYEDHFLSPDTFQWQSQRSTTQASKRGDEIRNHAMKGITLHLFVRRDAKTPQGTGAPFYYCGEVDFLKWHGEKPITVQLRLRHPLPSRLQQQFRIPK
jgi:hypothetical protein